jgi:hypothetical protein
MTMLLGGLLAGHFLGSRSPPRAAPDMKHGHDTSVVIDGEEDPICVRLPPVGQHPYRVLGVEILGRCGTALRMLVERAEMLIGV